MTWRVHTYMVYHLPIMAGGESGSDDGGAEMPIEYGGGGDGDVSGSEGDDEVPAEFAAIAVADKPPPRPPARAPSTAAAKPKTRRGSSRRRLSRQLSQACPAASAVRPAAPAVSTTPRTLIHSRHVSARRRCPSQTARTRRMRSSRTSSRCRDAAEMRPRCGRDAALHDPAQPSSYGRWCITFII